MHKVSSSALCVSVLFPLVCILTLSSGVIVLYVTMSVASSLGLPQPPVAVQTASQAAGVVGTEWDLVSRPTFWDGVATEAVFAKDVGFKGRAFGLAAAGSLLLYPTPTQTAGVETTYGPPLNPGNGVVPVTLGTEADAYSFDVSAPIAAYSATDARTVWSASLEFNRKRTVIGGNGVANTETATIFSIPDYTPPVAPATFRTTSGAEVPPLVTWNSPCSFGSNSGTNTTNADGTRKRIVVPGLTPSAVIVGNYMQNAAGNLDYAEPASMLALTADPAGGGFFVDCVGGAPINGGGAGAPFAYFICSR